MHTMPSQFIVCVVLCFVFAFGMGCKEKYKNMQTYDAPDPIARSFSAFENSYFYEKYRCRKDSRGVRGKGYRVYSLRHGCVLHAYQHAGGVFRIRISWSGEISFGPNQSGPSLVVAEVIQWFTKTTDERESIKKFFLNSPNRGASSRVGRLEVRASKNHRWLELSVKMPGYQQFESPSGKATNPKVQEKCDPPIAQKPKVQERKEPQKKGGDDTEFVLKKTFKMTAPGCTNKAVFIKIFELMRQRDKVAAHRLLNIKKLQGVCIWFQKGETVYVMEGSGLLSSEIKVRRFGRLAEYWVDENWFE